jgi:hypothetical protein
MNSDDHKARKLEIKKQCAAAVEWLLQEPTETPTTAARIFKVEGHANSIRMALVRRRSRMRNNRGAFNGHGGNNKILAEYQEQIIHQYCFDQWEMGLGATKQMVFAAITYLLKHENPPRLAPT